MDSSIVVAFLTGILGPAGLILLKWYLDNKKKSVHDPVAEALETSEKIMAKLDQIKEEIGADRVWITQFHNGGHFYPTGKSITKFSMVYEVVSSNTTSIQNSFQNIPVSLFSRSTNYLLENDIIEIPDYKDETIATYGLKYVAADNGTKSGYLFAIKTLDNKFVGCLGADFTKRKTRLSGEDIAHLSNHAAGIGGVLEAHLNKR